MYNSVKTFYKTKHFETLYKAMLQYMYMYMYRGTGSYRLFKKVQLAKHE